MRKTLGLCLFVLLLTVSTIAGEIPNETPTPPPPSQPASTVQEPTTAGEIPNEVTDTLTQCALELLAVLPSIL
jgi:hypothetical protein